MVCSWMIRVDYHIVIEVVLVNDSLPCTACQKVCRGFITDGCGELPFGPKLGALLLISPTPTTIVDKAHDIVLELKISIASTPSGNRVLTVLVSPAERSALSGAVKYVHRHFGKVSQLSQPACARTACPGENNGPSAGIRWGRSSPPIISPWCTTGLGIQSRSPKDSPTFVKTDRYPTELIGPCPVP